MEFWTVSYFEENRDYCLQTLTNLQLLEKLPLLNNFTSGSTTFNNRLIRFKGMIQDILNPVYYIEKFHVVNTSTNVTSLRSGKYRNVVDLEEDEKILHDSSEKVYKEKYIMHCIPVPGLNSWTKQFKFVDRQSSVSCREDKRKLEADCDMSVDKNQLQTEYTNRHKRIATENHFLNEENYVENPGSQTEPTSSHIIQTSEKSHGTQNVLLNLYDFKDDGFRVNDVVEVVGFFNAKSHCETVDEGDDSFFDALPTIHVIYIIPGTSTFSHMLQLQKEYIFQNACSLRDELWIALTDVLLGDTLAADYLICNLISAVYSRKDSLVLGKFSLNLSNIPVELGNVNYVSSLYSFLAHIIEKSIFMPLTIDYLNSANLIPRKDNEQNHLIPGLLQVSAKTHFVIDETKLEPGTLGDRGVRNVQALSEIINSQRLEYDFEFYKLPFHTDVPILTLSLTKSLLPSDFHVVLEPDESCLRSVNDSFIRAWNKLNDPLLSELRFYLSNISSLEYDLSSEMRQIIEKDYVKMRQDQTLNATGDDLHRLLVLARSISLSRGSKTLRHEAWEYACKMENQRRTRLGS